MQPSNLKVGLAMWSLPQWQYKLQHASLPSQRHHLHADRLAHYSETFQTVEGNTTFYASPTTQTVKLWRNAVQDDFRFTFKLPQQITHQLKLTNAQEELNAFLKLMEPLMEVTGIWKIQLPAQFAPTDLPTLAKFIKTLPQDLTFGVEVRHSAFFQKGDEEKQLNRLLHSNQLNRIILDSRALFACLAKDALTLDAKQKKPNVPVHAIATSQNPVIRFIGELDEHANISAFAPWVSKIQQWLNEGKSPYLFIHTPDNIFAPELTVSLCALLKKNGVNAPNLSLPKQSEQFDLF